MYSPGISLYEKNPYALVLVPIRLSPESESVTKPLTVKLSWAKLRSAQAENNRQMKKIYFKRKRVLEAEFRYTIFLQI